MFGRILLYIRTPALNNGSPQYAKSLIVTGRHFVGLCRGTWAVKTSCYYWHCAGNSVKVKVSVLLFFCIVSFSILRPIGKELNHTSTLSYYKIRVVCVNVNLRPRCNGRISRCCHLERVSTLIRPGPREGQVRWRQPTRGSRRRVHFDFFLRVPTMFPPTMCDSGGGASPGKAER